MNYILSSYLRRSGAESATSSRKPVRPHCVGIAPNFSEYSVRQFGATKISVRQVRSTQVRGMEIGSPKRRSRQVDISQARRLKVSVIQAGTGESRAIQSRVGKSDHAKIGVVESASLPDRTACPRTGEVGVAKVDVREPCVGKVGTTKVNPPQGQPCLAPYGRPSAEHGHCPLHVGARSRSLGSVSSIDGVGWASRLFGSPACQGAPLRTNAVKISATGVRSCSEFFASRSNV